MIFGNGGTHRVLGVSFFLDFGTPHDRFVTRAKSSRRSLQTRRRAPHSGAAGPPASRTRRIAAAGFDVADYLSGSPRQPALSRKIAPAVFQALRFHEFADNFPGLLA